MGNKRAPYIIGTIIASVAITLAFAAIIPAINQTQTSSTSLNTLGHLILIVTDPNEGVIHYVQTDNLVNQNAMSRIQGFLFTDGTTVLKPYIFLTLCQGVDGGTATASTNNECGGDEAANEMSGTLGRFEAGNSPIALTTETGAVNTSIFQGTITIGNDDNDVTFGEIALFNQDGPGGDMFSVATFTPFNAKNGQEVFMKYTIDINQG